MHSVCYEDGNREYDEGFQSMWDMGYEDGTGKYKMRIAIMFGKLGWEQFESWRLAQCVGKEDGKTDYDEYWDSVWDMRMRTVSKMTIGTVCGIWGWEQWVRWRLEQCVVYEDGNSE